MTEGTPHVGTAPAALSAAPAAVVSAKSAVPAAEAKKDVTQPPEIKCTSGGTVFTTLKKNSIGAILDKNGCEILNGRSIGFYCDGTNIDRNIEKCPLPDQDAQPVVQTVPAVQSAPPSAGDKTAPPKQILINFSMETMQNYADMYYKVHKANSQLLQTNQEYACQRAVNFFATYAMTLRRPNGTSEIYNIDFSLPAYDQNNPYYNPVDDLPNIVNMFKEEGVKTNSVDCSSGDIEELTGVEYKVDTNQWIGQGCMGGRDSVIHHTFYQSSISSGQSVSCGDSATLNIKVQ